MRKSANLPRNLVVIRRAKENKREAKRKKLALIPKVSGNVRAGGWFGADRWSGLAPRKIEGFMLYVRGHKITEEIWKKLYPEIEYGTRMRMI